MPPSRCLRLAAEQASTSKRFCILWCQIGSDPFIDLFWVIQNGQTPLCQAKKGRGAPIVPLLLRGFRLWGRQRRGRRRMSEELSIDELASNLSTYKEQLHQVKKLLEDDPENFEYRDMEKELQEVISLTEELLSTAKKSELTGLATSIDADASPDLHEVNETSSFERASGIFSGSYERLPVGSKVQAVWSEDGEWYDATIDAVTANGYSVFYDGWGNKEEVDPDNIRPRQEGNVDALVEAEREAEATKQAIKRKIAQAAGTDVFSRTLPAKLRIEPNDPEDVKAAKRKKIHAFKSKVRLEQLEVTQNKRQNAWQQFQMSKGQTKKVGFFSGRKRESIFKSPDDPKGKVGVTGSGKGLTEFQKREKHLHLKGAIADTEE